MHACPAASKEGGVRAGGARFPALLRRDKRFIHGILKRHEQLLGQDICFSLRQIPTRVRHLLSALHQKLLAGEQQTALFPQIQGSGKARRTRGVTRWRRAVGTDAFPKQEEKTNQEKMPHRQRLKGSSRERLLTEFYNRCKRLHSAQPPTRHLYKAQCSAGQRW